MKLRLVLMSVTLMLLLGVSLDFARRRLASDFQSQLQQREFEELKALAHSEELRLIHDGALWQGQLHSDDENHLDSQPHELRVVPSTQATQRIAGRILHRDSPVTALYEMHECNPGSSACSTGGTISIESSNRPIGSISVSLLQPDENGQLRSTFQVNWRDASLSQSEKVEILKELAGPETPSDHATLGQTLRAAYLGSTGPRRDTESTTTAHGTLLRAILLGILDAVAAQSA